MSLGKEDLAKPHLNKVEVVDVKKKSLRGRIFLFSLHFLYPSSSCTLPDIVIAGETKEEKQTGQNFGKSLALESFIKKKKKRHLLSAALWACHRGCRRLLEAGGGAGTPHAGGGAPKGCARPSAGVHSVLTSLAGWTCLTKEGDFSETNTNGVHQ